jgi:hypothetical protein
VKKRRKTRKTPKNESIKMENQKDPGRVEIYLALLQGTVPVVHLVLQHLTPLSIVYEHHSLQAKL